MMISCTNCGAEMSDNAKFCPDCGHPANSAPDELAPEQKIGSVETDPNILDWTDPPVPESELDSLEPGAMVAGKFRIERAIGQGGMGRVYLGSELIANGERERPGALKVIAEKYVGSEKAVQRLLDEGLISQDLAHRYIVKMYDIGVHGIQPYIAMEFIEGKPLHIWRGEKMAKNENVPVRVAGQIIKEVLNGLDAAHDAGVIHRDLKPENIMLLDEPFTGIDPLAVSDISELVGYLKDRGLGVLITDHQVRETLQIVDRASIIYEGNVLFEGAPEDVLASEDVRRVYLGERFAA